MHKALNYLYKIENIFSTRPESAMEDRPQCLSESEETSDANEEVIVMQRPVGGSR